MGGEGRGGQGMGGDVNIKNKLLTREMLYEHNTLLLSLYSVTPTVI